MDSQQVDVQPAEHKSGGGPTLSGVSGPPPSDGRQLSVSRPAGKRNARASLREAISQRIHTALDDTKWKPFEHTYTPKWLNMRWAMLNPFQRRLFSCWSLTIGEFLIGFLCLAACGAFDGITGLAADEHGVGGTGTVPQLLLAATFGTVSHQSVWTFLVGIPFERALAWHKFFAYLSILTGLWHGYDAYQAMGFDFSNGTYLTGVVLWGGMFLLFATSINVIRRKLFEVFFILHYVCIAIVVAFGLIHGAGALMIGFGLYGLDVLVRYGYQACKQNPTEVEIIRLPSNVVRVRFPKGNFHYHGGQYVFINIPELSVFEWHPFSLSSAPFEPDVMLHVRVLGDWTKRLYDLAAKHSGPIRVKAYIDGPCGEPSVDVEGSKYRCFLLVSGGIGITPMQSIANELLEQYSRGRELTKLWFVWTVRSPAMLASLLEYDSNGAPPGSSPSMPDVFSPDLLVTHESTLSDTNDAEGGTPEHNPLHCDYHITRMKSLDPQVANAHNIHPDVQTCLRFGRPDMPAVFARMREIAAAAGDRRVAVLACGPTCLIDPVRKLCWTQSKDGVTFDFHSETFEF